METTWLREEGRSIQKVILKLGHSEQLNVARVHDAKAGGGSEELGGCLTDRKGVFYCIKKGCLGCRLESRKVVDLEGSGSGFISVTSFPFRTGVLTCTM